MVEPVGRIIAVTHDQPLLIPFELRAMTLHVDLGVIDTNDLDLAGFARHDKLGSLGEAGAFSLGLIDSEVRSDDRNLLQLVARSRPVLENVVLWHPDDGQPRPFVA